MKGPAKADARSDMDSHTFNALNISWHIPSRSWDSELSSLEPCSVRSQQAQHIALYQVHQERQSV